MANRKGQGRRPQPTVLKIARGVHKNQPRRVNRNEPKTDNKRPPCPAHIKDEAAREWERICDTLEGMGILSTAYTQALELYCDSYAKWRQATAMVEQVGQALVRRDANGVVSVARNPFATEAHKHKDACLRFLTEFGLTPSSKSRIMTDTKEEVADRWASFLEGANLG